MSEELVVTKKELEEAPTVHLVARNPLEMQNAQTELALWLNRKLLSVELEIKELNAALDEARTNGWAVATLTRQRNKAVGEETFYFKLLTAVNAGYTIIPDFPIDVFAIRVTRSGVRAPIEKACYSHPEVRDELPDVRPVGEGEYKNPEQTVRRSQYKRNEGTDKESTVYVTRAIDFVEEVVFPLQAARPVVMNATAKAMALKVFDQIGVCLPNRGRKGDPLIIGQILGQRSSYSQKCISFIIAWHLNLEEL